jgi:hypothetical protein
MQQSFLFLFLVLQIFSYGQRSGRRPLHANPVYVSYEEPTFSGQCFKLTLINDDTIAVLLRIRPGKRIEHSDTLNLPRIYSCIDPTREHYDLDYSAQWESSCVRWYSLQLIKPRDTLHFTVNLKDFGEADSARLYFCFTQQILKVDTNLDLYSDPKKIYIMKEGRDFQTNYIRLSGSKPNTISLPKSNLSSRIFTDIPSHSNGK